LAWFFEDMVYMLLMNCWSLWHCDSIPTISVFNLCLHLQFCP